MGVLYHLRHPLLALELLHENVVADVLVTQSLLRGAKESMEVARDFPFWEEEVFERDEFPRMYFVENRFANDPTNWWIPNRSCFEAMLRSAGFEILDHPEDEVFICRRTDISGPLNYTKELREITR
jgi:tRNA (mo5U34)-methyltransferase